MSRGKFWGLHASKYVHVSYLAYRVKGCWITQVILVNLNGNTLTFAVCFHFEASDYVPHPWVDNLSANIRYTARIERVLEYIWWAEALVWWTVGISWMYGTEQPSRDVGWPKYNIAWSTFSRGSPPETRYLLTPTLQPSLLSLWQTVNMTSIFRQMAKLCHSSVELRFTFICREMPRKTRPVVSGTHHTHVAG